MKLSAIRPRKSGIEAQAATETAERNFGASNGGMLLKDTRPVIEAMAKGLREALSVKPGGDLGLSTRAPAAAPVAPRIRIRERLQPTPPTPIERTCIHAVRSG